MRRGREAIDASFVKPVERGVSRREGDVCCFALRFFFFFGVEVVEEAVATEMGESARTEQVALSVATASCRESAGCDFHSGFVSRSAAWISGDVISIFLVRSLWFRQGLSLYKLEGSRSYVLDAN